VRGRVELTLGIDLGTSGVKAGLLNMGTLELDRVTWRAYEAAGQKDPALNITPGGPTPFH
jgi:sugar (pentulose or hexulose) kinase